MSGPQLANAAGGLVLVVGPSGAGKDTLLDAARSALKIDAAFVFPRRVVTRPSDAGGEDHIAATSEQFLEDAAAGAHALSWGAHGLNYAIPATIFDDLAAGAIVVVNVSRASIPAAEALGYRTLIVHITAAPEYLARRIAARGRESEADIRSRLSREVPLPQSGVPVVEIRNEGSIEAAGAAFVEALRQFKCQSTQSGR